MNPDNPTPVPQPPTPPQPVPPPTPSVYDSVVITETSATPQPSPAAAAAPSSRWLLYLLLPLALLAGLGYYYLTSSSVSVVAPQSANVEAPSETGASRAASGRAVSSEEELRVAAAQAKAILTSGRAYAELHFESTENDEGANGTYVGFCESEWMVSDAAKAPLVRLTDCRVSANGDAYLLTATLSNGTIWCADSNRNLAEVPGAPAGPYCSSNVPPAPTDPEDDPAIRYARLRAAVAMEKSILWNAHGSAELRFNKMGTYAGFCEGEWKSDSSSLTGQTSCQVSADGTAYFVTAVLPDNVLGCVDSKGPLVEVSSMPAGPHCR